MLSKGQMFKRSNQDLEYITNKTENGTEEKFVSHTE